MTEWTRDMVEERIVEAARVLGKLPGPAAGLLQHMARHAAQRPRDRAPGAEADEGASVAAGDQPHGGGDHLEPLPAAGGGAPHVGPRRRHAVEGYLPSLPHQPADAHPGAGSMRSA